MSISVGVIGGGPSAAATVMGLLGAENLRITLISTISENLANQDFKNMETLNLKKNQRSKRKYQPFEIDKNFLLNIASSKVIPTNLSQGGWSKFWGATLAEWSEDAEIYNEISARDLKNEYEIIRNQIPSIKDSAHNYRSDLVEELISDFQYLQTMQHESIERFRIFPSDLAIWNNTIQPNPCVFCAKCLSGCETQSIYNSDQTLENFRELAGDKFSRCFEYVERIEETQNKIRVYLSNTKHLDFDFVFVASGLMSSVGLIQRSSLVGDIEFQETPMFLIPFIKLKQKTKATPSKISLSEAFVEILDGSSKNIIGSGQVYSFTKNLQEVAFGKVVSRFIPLIPHFITKRIIVLMFFSKPLDEPNITIKNLGGVSEINFPKSYHRKNYKKLIRQVRANFRIVGFWSVFKMSILERPGLSYHYAGARDRITKDSITDENGLLKSTKNGRIFLSDASCLTSIEPGPITMTIMANNIRIATNFVKSKI